MNTCWFVDCGNEKTTLKGRQSRDYTKMMRILEGQC